MAHENIALIAHLMRRAGFGATREELEAYAAKGYEATVEELLNPEAQEAVDRLDLFRYHPGMFKPGTQAGEGSAEWLFYMINTKRHLEEKMTVFWHQIFATGVSKVDHYHELNYMIDLFREQGLGNYRDLLMAVAKNPAMIYWLDQNENRARSINENWGRELLELFSMGVGNYTEDDVRDAARAFTGWTIASHIPRIPYQRNDWTFEYRPGDHDDGEKTFLGHTGQFNGEEIIDIIVQQPACHRFIARHLYSFFVADEVQVPAWQITPPKDSQAIDILAAALSDSGLEMKAVMRTLFNSDFFKDARFLKVRSPAEVVAGTLRLTGGQEFAGPFFLPLARETGFMGQDLLNPASVEGWHTGEEWVNSGSLMTRINFMCERLGDTSLPGIRDIVDRLRVQGDLSPEAFVDSCLDLLGPLTVEDGTRQKFIDQTSLAGTLLWHSPDAEQRVSSMVKSIVATREFQFA
jgi:hypothetical protein